MQIVILAGGKGTRMQGKTAKPLYKIWGQEMIVRIINNLLKAGEENIVVVVGHRGKKVEEIVRKRWKKVRFLEQKDISGTGQAILEALEDKGVKIEDNFVVLNADDAMFYDFEKMEKLFRSHTVNKRVVSAWVVEDTENRKYRKVHLDAKGGFVKLSRKVETKGWILTGLYVFEKKFIYSFLIQATKVEGELRLTDCLYVEDQKHRFGIERISQDEWFGINTKDELKLARQKWKKKADTE